MKKFALTFLFVSLFSLATFAQQTQTSSRTTACGNLPATLFEFPASNSQYLPYQATNVLKGTLADAISRIQAAKINGVKNVFLDRTFSKLDGGGFGFVTDTAIAIGSFEEKISGEKHEAGTLYASFLIARSETKTRIVLYNIEFIYKLSGSKLTLKALADEIDPNAILEMETEGDFKKNEKDRQKREQYLCMQINRINKKMLQLLQNLENQTYSPEK